MKKQDIIFYAMITGIICGSLLLFQFMSKEEITCEVISSVSKEVIVPAETLTPTPIATTTPTPAPTPTPRIPATMNFTIEQGTLYTIEMVNQWQCQIETYLLRDDLTEAETEQLNQDAEMCQIMFDLLNYRVKKHETLIQVLAKTVTQEIGGLSDASSHSTANMERAAVIWCILNRVDHNYDTSVCGEELAKYISRTTKSPDQFAYCYSSSIFTGTEEISADVLIRWLLEKYGYESGRVLPSNYRYFGGHNGHNHFRTTYNTRKATYWDWSLPDPYKTN